MNLDQHISEISRLRREADALPEDSPGALMKQEVEGIWIVT